MAIQQNLTLPWLDEPSDRFQQCGFAAARRTEKNEAIRFPDIEADILCGADNTSGRLVFKRHLIHRKDGWWQGVILIVRRRGRSGAVHAIFRTGCGAPLMDPA